EKNLEQVIKEKETLDQILSGEEIYRENNKGKLSQTLARHHELDSRENELLNQMEHLTNELEKV
ncbi:MAG: hypothetical protein VYC17_06335, partial [Nitrospinota bacterium]|nr:hypothetical protein [Nitrospinota bacterium]